MNGVRGLSSGPQPLLVEELRADLEAEAPHHATRAARPRRVRDHERKIVGKLALAMEADAVLGHVDDEAVARRAGHLDLDARIAIEALARGLAPFDEHGSPRRSAGCSAAVWFNSPMLAGGTRRRWRFSRNLAASIHP